MGWADMLVLLGIRYNSVKGFGLAREIMSFIQMRAKETSVELAGERGLFPNFKGSIYDAPGMPKVRNATTTTIAPTGTLSIIADCSSGIEPIFGIVYRRLVMDRELGFKNRHFFSLAKKAGFYTKELEEEVMKKGSLKEIRGVPDWIRELFETAHEIPPEAHLEMQSAFQEYTDNAVSKTINLPEKTPREEIRNIIIRAYEKGCKGVTVFRYATERGGPLRLSVED
jgi:ribonucleoside-diphosphate reductase alpha chain